MDEKKMNEHVEACCEEESQLEYGCGCGCDDSDMPEGDSASRVKKIAALVIGAIIVLALFAGILMRADAVLTSVKTMRDEVVASQEKTQTVLAQVSETLTKAEASLAAIEAKTGDSAGTAKDVSEALTEIRGLFKQTNASLNQALESKDALMREALNKLNVPAEAPKAPAAESN